MPIKRNDLPAGEVLNGIAVEFDLYGASSAQSLGQRLRASRWNRGSDMAFTVLPLSNPTAILSYSVETGGLWVEVTNAAMSPLIDRGRISSLLDLSNAVVTARLVGNGERARVVVQQAKLETLTIQSGSQAYGYASSRKSDASAYLWESAPLQKVAEETSEDGNPVYQFRFPDASSTGSRP